MQGCTNSCFYPDVGLVWAARVLQEQSNARRANSQARRKQQVVRELTLQSLNPDYESFIHGQGRHVSAVVRKARGLHHAVVPLHENSSPRQDKAHVFLCHVTVCVRDSTSVGGH